MKPDWKDAPEWANWLTMDLDGTWYWWDVEPVPAGNIWVNGITDRKLQHAGNSLWKEIKENRPNSP